jgi:DNA polymerase-3 subunit beta
MQVLSSQQNHQVRFILKKDELELSTLNRETGAEAHERASAQYDDEPMEIGYNANYLKEILTKTDSDQVEFNFREPVSAAIIKPAKQPDGEDYFCLLMPLRLLNADS